jgi:SAM-dependent methyltransferase
MKRRYTGERMDNDKHSTNFIVSLNRYKFARRLIKSTDVVLDISCGTGYGSNYLSKYSKEVVGLDVDNSTLEQARKSYSNKNLKFELIDANGVIPTKYHGKFDLVVSFETIEHSTNTAGFLKNLSRCVKDGGTIIISTPNNYEKIHPPKNRFHIYEFELTEFEELLRRSFPLSVVQTYGQIPTNNKKYKINRHKFKKTVFNIINFVWMLDYKTLQLFQRIEGMGFYKKLGSFQRDRGDDFSIYKIKTNTNFTHPVTGIFIVR